MKQMIEESIEANMMLEENNVGTGSKIGISGSTLKLIAIISMLIDHIGAVVVLRMVLENAAGTGIILGDGMLELYHILRDIGRLAFPIYCFLLVEGFQRTHNKAQYAFHLGAFSLISEIPFDLAFSSQLLEFCYQNVFFTLFIGLVTMIAVDAVEKNVQTVLSEKSNKALKITGYLIELVLVTAGAYGAELLRTDYGAKGVLCILILYIFRRVKVLQMVIGGISFYWDGVAPFAFIPIAFYNGKRGLRLKYVFYLFYPIHLLVLYAVCVVLGLGGYAVV